MRNTSLSQLLKDNSELRSILIEQFEVSPSVYDRWEDGTTSPHPLLKDAIWHFVLEENDKNHGMSALKANKKKAIEAILVKADPIGLIKMGAPKDEYASEAEDITHHLFNCKSAEEMNRIVWAVFICAFNVGAAGRLEDWQIIADDIWLLKNIGFEKPTIAQRGLNLAKDAVKEQINVAAKILRRVRGL